MQTDSDELLARLLEELTQAAQSGNQPDLDAVARQHPELADELRALWTTASVFEDLAGIAQLDQAADPSSEDADPAPGRAGPRRNGHRLPGPPPAP